MSAASAHHLHECREVAQIIRRAGTSSSSSTHDELPMIDITCKRQQQTDNNHKCIEPSSQTAQIKQNKKQGHERNKANSVHTSLQTQEQLISNDIGDPHTAQHYSLSLSIYMKYVYTHIHMYIHICSFRFYLEGTGTRNADGPQIDAFHNAL